MWIASCMDSLPSAVSVLKIWESSAECSVKEVDFISRVMRRSSISNQLFFIALNTCSWFSLYFQVFHFFNTFRCFEQEFVIIEEHWLCQWYRFLLHLAESRCLYNYLWDMWWILALHSSLHSRCHRHHANYDDWSIWTEIKARSFFFHNTSPGFHFALQWILQDPLPSCILPVLSQGKVVFSFLISEETKSYLSKSLHLTWSYAC